jgi:hypothetical protein
LSVAPAEVGRRSPRIGLLEGRTGVPLFLLSLRHVADVERAELSSSADVEARARAADHPDDRQAWESLLPFFEAEGTRALVHASPFREDPLTALVGVDRGLDRRSGLSALPLYRDVADLVVVPQASRWLDGERHRQFHTLLFDKLALDPHFFALTDLPLAFSGDDARAWLRGMTSPDAAVLFPWLCREHEVVAPATVAAAAVQRNDERFGIHRLPANQPLARGFRPLRRHSPAELVALVEERLTVWHQFAESATCLWGGATLATPGDDAARFWSSRRTLLAVREAVHRVCEPFVLEPLLTGIEKAVDVALESAFEPLRKFFSNTTKQALTTQVRIERRRGEDVLVVDVQCRLPYALGEVSFRLGMAA